METEAVPLPQTDWFPAAAFHPALPGYYKVRGGVNLPVRSTLRLVGVDLRYWNGSAWLTWERGLVSDFGRHDTHQWCGQRRWVLGVAGGPLSGQYLLSARPRSYKSTADIQHARPFGSIDDAMRFADRFPRLGLVPILA